MSMHRAQGKSIVAAGVKTNYHEMGSGPPLILLHGSGSGVSAWENWHRVMPAFSERFRVLAPDIVGFGLTERPSEAKFNIKLWVNHLLGFMDATGIDKASLAGNSFGGALAMATALSNPHRLSRLVLMGTPAGEFERINKSSSWHYEPSLESMTDLLKGFPYDPACVTTEMVAERYAMSLLSDSKDAYRKLFPQPDEVATTTTVKGIPVKDLTRIVHPALVLHGREDRIVPKECGLRIAENIPDAELHLFGKCGHWVQIERQQDFIRLSMDFLISSRPGSVA